MHFMSKRVDLQVTKRYNFDESQRILFWRGGEDMDKILDFIVSVIEKNDSTSEDEKEEIRYGLEIIFLKALFWILVLATGVIMGCFWECVIYNILFFLLRSNAGGYHAATRTRCLIQSEITVIISLTAIRICRESLCGFVILAVIALLCGIAVWILAPVDTESRQLDADEIRRFGNRARVILAVETAVGIGAYFLGSKTIACAAMAAVATSGMLVLAEYLKKYNNGEKYE